MQTAPMTAQNVLPVMEDPVNRPVPWPTQTTPVRNRTAPTTRLAMVTTGTTRGPVRPVFDLLQHRDVVTAAALLEQPADPPLCAFEEGRHFVRRDDQVVEPGPDEVAVANAQP